MKEVFIIKRLLGITSNAYLTNHNDFSTILTDAMWVDSYEKAKLVIEDLVPGYYQIDKIICRTIG